MQHRTEELQAEQFVESYMPRVRLAAVRLHRNLPNHMDIDDLIGAGMIGLLQAAQRFDGARGVDFGAYAAHRIRGAMLDSLRDGDWASRDLRKSSKAMQRASHKVSCKLGRAASIDEVSREMNITDEQLLNLQAKLHSVELLSLDAPQTSADESESLSETIAANDPDPFDQYEGLEVKALLTKVIQELPPRDRLVLELYYYEELTMKEVGQVLGIDESRVSQIHVVLLRQLRSRVCQILRRETTCQS
jgi:RNA polymerase sigma factor for flagellar operon FliA